MDERYLCQKIAEAVKSVFNMMAGISLEEKEVITSKEEIRGDITGIIGFSNEQTKGSMAISFPIKLAKKTVANMLVSDPESITEDDLIDGIGEIANMVIGDFNNRIENIFTISLPSVVTGKNHLVSFFHDGSPVIISFSDKEGNLLYVLTTLEKIKRR